MYGMGSINAFLLETAIKMFTKKKAEIKRILHTPRNWIITFSLSGLEYNMK
jgi:hypothetical protein